MQLDFCLLLSPNVVNALLDGFVLEAVEDCIYCWRAEHEKLNEINDDVQDSLSRFNVVCLRSELLAFSVETEDDDEEIIGAIEDDDGCNQLKNDNRSFLTFLPQLKWIRLRWV